MMNWSGRGRQRSWPVLMYSYIDCYQFDRCVSGETGGDTDG